MRWLTGTGAVVVLFSFAAAGCGSDQSESSGSELTLEEKQAAVWLTAQELVDRYEANEARANHELKGKWLIVSGRVGNIEEHEVFGGYTVYLDTNRMLTSIHCKTDDADFALSLEKGTNVVVAGVGDGQIMGSPFLERCALYSG